MDVIEICPPKKLVFTLPDDLHRVLTVNNISLRSTFLYVLTTHPYEISLSSRTMLMQPFQEIKIDVTVNYNQEGCNLSRSKLRVYYLQVEQDENRQELEVRILKERNYEQIEIELTLNSKIINTLNYRYREIQSSSYEETHLQEITAGNHFFAMKRIYCGHNQPHKVQEQLKNQIFNHLQQLSFVNSILESQNINNFLVEIDGKEKPFASFIEFTIDQCLFIYSLVRIVAYGKSFIMPSLVNIEQNIQEKKNIKEKHIVQANNHKMSSFSKENSQEKMISEAKIKQSGEKQEKDQHEHKNVIKQNIVNNKLKVKQSFIMKKESQSKKNKRRNKSEEKIVQNSDQSQDQQPFFLKQSLKDINFKKLTLNKQKIQQKSPIIIQKEIKIRYETKLTETNIEMSQKILNIHFIKKEECTYVHVLLRDSIRCFMLQDSNYKKVFKFDPIDEDHIQMPSPIDSYQNEIIFGNESYLFWVNIQNGYNEWKYVQRKYIYAVSVIQELSLVAIGGKNFSKLSYFGKETSRSNIKLYSCSSEDKHDHLFTYDIPGVNVGNVTNMLYISVPPHNTKLLLVHTTNTEQSKFYFFRIKAFNKFQIYGEVEIDELGILNLLKIKYNKETQRIVCMEELGDINIDSFKRLKIRCQYEKVEINTEGFKFPLKRYLSYHLGGSKDAASCAEWMSFVEQNGSVFHVYQFQSNKSEQFDIPKGQLKHAFWLNNGKYLLLGYESMILIREKTQVAIKQA